MNPAVAEPEVLVEILDNGIGRVSFNRPDSANAVFPALMKALQGLFMPRRGEQHALRRGAGPTSPACGQALVLAAGDAP